jgi:hypothetical protein
VREAALWVSGAALAFFVTAGAFLLLANLGTGPSEESLPPDPQRAESGPALELNLDEDQLASLRALPDQRLDVGVENSGDEDLSGVNLTLEVSSENTALSGARYYREKVDTLAAGRSTTVSFYPNLSEGEGTIPTAVPEPPRKILEVRATTPTGVSAVKTAVLPPRPAP